MSYCVMRGVANMADSVAAVCTETFYTQKKKRVNERGSEGIGIKVCVLALL